jgi:hypothetical protein
LEITESGDSFTVSGNGFEDQLRHLPSSEPCRIRREGGRPGAGTGGRQPLQRR